jgi:hypothetical protein
MKDIKEVKDRQNRTVLKGRWWRNCVQCLSWIPISIPPFHIPSISMTEPQRHGEWMDRRQGRGIWNGGMEGNRR